jgi:hypothetical protein
LQYFSVIASNTLTKHELRTVMIAIFAPSPASQAHSQVVEVRPREHRNQTIVVVHASIPILGKGEMKLWLALLSLCVEHLAHLKDGLSKLF